MISRAHEYRKIGEVMNCTKCGYGLSEGNPICSNCGALNKISADAPQPPPGMAVQRSAESQETETPEQPFNPSHQEPQGETAYQDSMPPQPIPQPPSQNQPFEAPETTQQQAAVAYSNMPTFQQAPVMPNTFAPASQAYAVSAKKKRWPIVAIIVALIVVVGLGGFLGFNAFGEYQRSSNYDSATSLLSQGDYQGARAKFSELNGYRDAAQLVSVCDAWIVFTKAEALTNQGKYEEALLMAKGFENVSAVKDSAKVKEWTKKNSYGLATQLYKTGQYYAAYTSFTSLGNYQDSIARAEACIQPTPGNVELYHNQAFRSTSTDIVFDARQATQFYYIKVYSGNTPVSTLFVNPGGTTTIQVPSGIYSFKRAIGGIWFGETDMFGEDGNYGQMLFDYSNESATLLDNRIYTVTLDNVESGNIGTKNLDPNNF